MPDESRKRYFLQRKTVELIKSIPLEIDPRSIGPGREEIYRSTVTIPGHSDICENIIVLTVFRKTIELNKRHFKEEKK